MARPLPPPDPGSVASHESAAYERVATRFGGAGAVGYFGALLHSPPICDAINSGSLAFRDAEKQGTLPTAIREWIDVVVGVELGSNWLVQAHLAAAVGAGVSPHAIKAIRERHLDDVEPADRERVAYIVSVVNGEVTDAAFAALVEQIGERPAVELTAFTCWVAMNTRLAQALGQPEVDAVTLDAAISSYL